MTAPHDDDITVGMTAAWVLCRVVHDLAMEMRPGTITEVERRDDGTVTAIRAREEHNGSLRTFRRYDGSWQCGAWDLFPGEDGSR